MDDGRLGPRERLVTAFFGVRGVGSIYYLAFATGQAEFGGTRVLWSTVAFTIVLSVLVHGGRGHARHALAGEGPPAAARRLNGAHDGAWADYGAAHDP